MYVLQGAKNTAATSAPNAISFGEHNSLGLLLRCRSFPGAGLRTQLKPTTMRHATQRCEVSAGEPSGREQGTTNGHRSVTAPSPPSCWYDAVCMYAALRSHVMGVRHPLDISDTRRHVSKLRGGMDHGLAVRGRRVWADIVPMRELGGFRE